MSVQVEHRRPLFLGEIIKPGDEYNYVGNWVPVNANDIGKSKTAVDCIWRKISSHEYNFLKGKQSSSQLLLIDKKETGAPETKVNANLEKLKWVELD